MTTPEAVIPMVDDVLTHRDVLTNCLQRPAEHAV
jgi:hypothetical protein